jgi:hypothetical protein
MYLTEKEWDAWRKKREGENHNVASKGGCSSSGGSSNKPTNDECRHFGKMGRSVCKCCSKSKKEHAHIAQDEEGSLLMKATLMHPEAGGPAAVHRANRRWWSDRAQDCETMG